MSNKNEQFQKTLDYLNPNQRRAVDIIEGPVMVIAGPGTGKTQILSARIANILQTGAQVNPENILCLTFTNAGRTAMRQRLIQLTDTPTANAVNIHTFHSFCNDVIQQYPESFDYDLQLVDELAQVDLLQQVQDSIAPSSPIFVRRSKEYQLKDLKELFEFIKKENIDVEKLTETLQEYSDTLEDNPTFQYKSNRGDHKKGDPNLKQIEDQRKAIKKSIARIELFPKYQRLMKEKGYYDYNDMIQWVIQALETDENMRFDFFERFSHILIDEFQDTNGAQFRLAELLTGYEHHNTPNIFVVGDDDQSIYRFQGANMKNLLDFRNKFEGNLEEIVLEQNYRSSQIILDGAKYLIEHSKNRLIDAIPGLEKNLKASNGAVADLKLKPKVLQMVNSAQEYIHIAKDIEKKIQEGTAPSDIAVLYSKHKFGNDFVKYLSALGVPFFIHKDLDFLSDPLALQLVDLLIYLDSESRDFDAYPNLLFEIFGFGFWGAAKDAGFMILASYRARRESKESFRAYVHRWCDENQDRSDLKTWEQDVIRMYRVIEGLVIDAQQNTLPVLINRIITKTKLHTYILERPNKFWNLEILKTLVEKSDQVFETKPSEALPYMLQEFQVMQASGITLPVTKLLGTKSGVNLMSIHGSKGLEYKHVYMIASDERSWRDTNRGNSLKVPKEFFAEMMAGIDRSKDPEEKRRLFYVAMTRAMESVTISLPMYDHKGDENTPVRYVNEMLEGYEDNVPENISLSTDEIEELEWNTLTQTHNIDLEPSEREILTERLQDFSLSVTGLYNYLDCPVRFYYNNLLRVPSGRSAALDFGSMMHDVLESYYKEAVKQGQHLGVDRLMEIYDREVNKNDEKFLDEKVQKEIQLGRSDLRMFYDQEILGSNLDVDLEEKLVHTFDHGLKITGIIDKVEIEDNNITIVDYKTGNPKADKVAAPNLGKRGAGTINNYWLQGLFYKLLAEKSPKYAGKHIKEVKFVFLTPQEDRTFLEAPIKVDDEQYNYTMELVYEAWEKIQNLEFSEGCGKEYCDWCNYQKSIENV